MKTCFLAVTKRATASVAAFAIGTTAALAQCGFKPAFNQHDEKGTTTVSIYEGSPVAALGNIKPLLFITTLKVNTDGTKISYHKDDPRGTRCKSDSAFATCAINNVRNAYRNTKHSVARFEALRDAGFPPAIWNLLSPRIIEKDSKSGKPCLTADGYLVSMTADVAVNGGHNKVGDCDPSKWIDALTMPAVVLPKGPDGIAEQFRKRGMRKRSIVVALSSGATARVVPGIVGDVGPAQDIGEANIAMNRTLNGLADSEQPKHYEDAKNRFQAGKTAVLMFPGADLVLARPITGQKINAAGTDTLQTFGGGAKLRDCIRNEVDPSF